MKRLIQRSLGVFKKEDGVTAIEYGLIAGLVAVAIITALNALATAIIATYTTISGHLGASPN
jgi:pilus assembly protein Flp/PilA